MKIFIFILFILLMSCSKKEKHYGASELWKMAVKVVPDIELVPITEPSKRVVCEHYTGSDGCVEASGRRIRVRKVELLAIEFEKESQARKAALAIDQYYAGNWVLDDVVDEPVLESFVKEAFDAKRPSLELNDKN